MGGGPAEKEDRAIFHVDQLPRSLVPLGCLLSRAVLTGVLGHVRSCAISVGTFVGRERRSGGDL